MTNRAWVNGRMLQLKAIYSCFEMQRVRRTLSVKCAQIIITQIESWPMAQMKANFERSQVVQCQVDMTNHSRIAGHRSTLFSCDNNLGAFAPHSYGIVWNPHVSALQWQINPSNVLFCFLPLQCSTLRHRDGYDQKCCQPQQITLFNHWVDNRKV